MSNIILSFLSSPLWAQFVSAFFIFFYVKKLTRKRNFPYLSSFSALGRVLVITSFLFWFFPHPFFFALQTLFVSQIYLKLLFRFTGKKPMGFLYWFYHSVFLLLGLADLLFDFIPWPLKYGFALSMIGSYLMLFFQYSKVTPFNTEHPALVLKTKSPLMTVPVVFHSLALIFTYRNPVLQAVGVPLFYMLHTYVLSIYERQYDFGAKKKLKTARNNLNSVFEFMELIGNAITEKVEMEKVMNFVVKSAVKSTGADGGAILMVDEFDDFLKVHAVDGDFPPPYKVPNAVRTKTQNLINYFKSTPIPIGQTILGEAAQTGKSIYVRDTAGDPRMVNNTKSDMLFISSMIVVPLILNKKVLGVLAIVSRRLTFRFSKDNFTHLTTFGDYTSLTINNLYTYMQLLEKQEMEREVGIAAEIQGQLLPSKLPRVSSISLAAYSLPAKGVSGDYYDVINLKKGQIMMVMCDVAGKGIPASLVMVMIRTIIHLVARQPTISTARILEIINWGVAGKIALDRFATMSLLTYDFYSHTLGYSNAAHHPLLIYRAASQSFEELDTEGIPIGLEKKTKYHQIHTKLEKDDILTLYTDGIIEAMNEKSQQYSVERLREILKDNSALPPEKIKKKVIDDVALFVGKARQHDDQTFLIMKVEN